jgi:hypothetical protein
MGDKYENIYEHIFGHGLEESPDSDYGFLSERIIGIRNSSYIPNTSATNNDNIPQNRDNNTPASSNDNDGPRGDDNIIDHESSTLEYVIIDEDIRQAMGAIFAADDLSTAGALEEFAKVGAKISVCPQQEKPEGGIIYKVLTDGVITLDTKGMLYRSRPNPTGLTVQKNDFLARNKYNLDMEVYIFKHDSLRYYKFPAEFKQVELNNDMNAAADNNPQPPRGRILRA